MRRNQYKIARIESIKLQINAWPLFIAMGVGLINLTCTHAQQTQSKIEITEASGIARYNDTLYIVSDATPGLYYLYDISGWNKIKGQIRLDDMTKVRISSLNLGPLKLDIEGLTMINGEVLAISESNMALLKKGMMLSEYPDLYGEFANRGLEGVAAQVQDSNCDIYQIAALWEGGYPETKKAPPGLAHTCLDRALNPIIITHIFQGKKELGSLRTIKLDMNTLNHLANEDKTTEPNAHRFRAPDLVWFRDGFIVLLSSERKTQGDGKDPEKYKFKLLQRFDLKGKPIGPPKHLKTKPDQNWEGMGWFKEGESLILIEDKKKPGPYIMIKDIPTEWKEQ